MNSTSVGKLLIAGTQVRNKRKTRRRRHKNAQKIVSGITLTKRAHLAEQTGVPHKMHDMVNTWAHLSACQRKEHLGEPHLGSPEPGRPPVQVYFGVEWHLLNLLPVDKVSMYMDTWSSPYFSSTTI